MSPKCIKVSSCVCFFIFSCGLLVLAALFLVSRGDRIYTSSSWSFQNPELTVEENEPLVGHGQMLCVLRDMSSGPSAEYGVPGKLNTPSLEAYIRASPEGVEGQELRLSGLAVHSKLANACQPLVDIRKSKFQGNKIALISLDELLCPICTLQDLAINAQNAGYSVMIFYFQTSASPTSPTSMPSDDHGIQTDTKNNLMIPVLYANITTCLEVFGRYFQLISTGVNSLEDADRRNVDISVQPEDYLTNLRWYLARLYYWFLLGPVITLEWLRRRKKLCFMPGALQQDHEETAIGAERGVGEGGLRTEAQEPVANYDQETEQDQTAGEEQPLIVRIVVVNDPPTNLMTTTSHGTSTRVVVLFRKIFGKLAVGCGYVILVIVALPVGISSGGLSFFRFDENEKLVTKSFWDSFLKFDVNNLESLATGNLSATFIGVTILDYFLPLWWSSLQIFCFFLYSRFACKTMWAVPTNSLKLIRSDWFASNLYLLILGVVVPYCSYTMIEIETLLFAYFATYNMVCTICNVLFIIILNKHKFVTRYVFYISVCMICAYVESAIVAVYYFMMNSEGSLANLKLTALRTVAIGLTLSLSFSSSMHIIRKLSKPRESLFEGLGEK